MPVANGLKIKSNMKKALRKKMLKSKFHLKRPKHPMPAFFKQALAESGLAGAYKARPPYQQNDYIWWKPRAGRNKTEAAQSNAG